MKKVIYQLILIFTVLLVLPESTLGFQQRQDRDSLQVVKDSLMSLLRMKDSLLLQSSLDSLYLNNLIFAKDMENDSLQHELRSMILQDKLDSVRQYSIDSVNRDFNRYTRWELSDFLYDIDEDSVRSSLDRLLEQVFHDDAKSPNGEILKEDMTTLFSHLANDSMHFFLINGVSDTIPFVMKNNYADSTSMFLVNNRKDSVKIYLYGNGKNSIYLVADDDFRLTQMLKKNVPPDILKRNWVDISGIKIPKRKVLAARPTNWSKGGNIDFSLSQLAYSHWAKGGANRASFIITSKGWANYKKGKMSWNNDYYYRYGVLKMEDVRLYKNLEQLRIKNSFSHQAFKNYHYSISSQFDSQFFPGYRSATDIVPVSKFMGPATYSLGLGMTYKPSKALTITGDPISGKFQFVLDTLTINPRAYGVPVGQRVKTTMGFKISGTYKKTLWGKINLNTTLGLFRSYVNNPMPDIDWMTDVKLKVFKYLDTKLFLYLKYDDDVILPDYEYVEGVRTKVGTGKFIQVNQTFGISFIFHF
jgi:hypothetical protein